MCVSWNWQCWILGCDMAKRGDDLNWILCGYRNPKRKSLHVSVIDFDRFVDCVVPNFCLSLSAFFSLFTSNHHSVRFLLFPRSPFTHFSLQLLLFKYPRPTKNKPAIILGLKKHQIQCSYLPTPKAKSNSQMKLKLTLAGLLILVALQGSKAVINIDEALSADGDNQRRWQHCFARG